MDLALTQSGEKAPEIQATADVTTNVGYMAEIFTFPIGRSSQTAGASRAASIEDDREMTVPSNVLRSVESVRAMRQRSGVIYREIPVPLTLSDYGIGVQIDVNNGSPVHSCGWIMVLYSEHPRTEWGSRWRCVAYGSVRISGSEHNGLTPPMMWDWLERTITGINEETLGGTVSLNRNTSFGSLSDPAGDPPRFDCELRVSWTPLEEKEGWVDAGTQVDVWARFLESLTTNDELEEPISDRE